MSGDANPYLNARREWDERMGDALARARNWRYAAFGALAIAALAVAGVDYIGAQSKIKPYVVVLDKMGNPLAMAQPATGGAIPQRITAAQIGNWIWDARTVLSDPTAQKTLIRRVYAMTGADAAAYLNDYFRKHPPFGGFVVDVTVRSVLPIGASTWQVTWNEQRTVNGQAQPLQHWSATLTTGVDPKLAEQPQVLLTNPLGLYIKHISWTQVAGDGS